MQHSDLTEADIGRAVRYTPKVGDSEYGIITSFNACLVFVRYFNQCLSKGTYADNLEYTMLYEDDPEMDDRGDGVDPGDDRSEF